MKKFLSVIMIAAMLLGSLSMFASATPAGKCLEFNSNGSYAELGDINLAAGDTTISFDVAMKANDIGVPVIKINGSAVEISTTYILAGNTRVNYSWGEAELKHWHHVDIEYLNGKVTVSMDGEAKAQGNGSCLTNVCYFVVFPGSTDIDNLKIVSAGNTIKSYDFESTATCKFNQLTAQFSTIAADSYSDYNETPVAESVQYIFDSEANCAKLTVKSGKKLLAGDIDGNNRLTSSDTLNVKKIVSGMIAKPANGTGDVNGDGRYNSNDIRTLKMMVIGSTPKRYIEEAAGATAVYNSSMKSALLTASSNVTNGVDATLTMDALNADDYKFAVVTYMTPNSEAVKNSAAARESAFGASGTFTKYSLNTDGKFHSQIIDLSNVSTWNGTTATLRFFTAANAGDVIYIDSIIFAANQAKADKAVLTREKAKQDMGIFDKPAVSNKLGEFDAQDNLVIKLDDEAKEEYAYGMNNATFNYDYNEDAFAAVATSGNDPSIYVNLLNEGISANQYKYLTYVYKIPSSTRREDPVVNFYYVCGSVDVPTGGYETDTYVLMKGTTYRMVTIDLSAFATWSGDIKGIRIDFFTDCFTNDTCYIDSLIFGKTESACKTAGNLRMKAKNGGSSSGTSPADIWLEYSDYHAKENNNTFVVGNGGQPYLYFRYASPDFLTARSLCDRLAKAIKDATDFDVEVEVYLGYYNLKRGYKNGTLSEADVCYTITYKDVSYVVYTKTCIINDASYHDELDGTSSDVEPADYNLGEWTSEGITVSNNYALPASSNGNAGHSNNENRLVYTPYGSFAAIPMRIINANSTGVGSAEFSVFKIADNGAYKTLGTYTLGNHTSKPSIYYAEDGLVYFCGGDAQDGSMSVYMGYFDPSKPKADGTYDIVYNRTTKNFAGGNAPGGYGYIQPVLDDTNGKIYIIACGGSNEGYLAWSIYNYKTHQWESNSYSMCMSNTNRHCYLYGYSDGANGIYLVGGRDVLLKTLGLYEVTGADYAWDEVNVIHIPNMHATNYTFMHANEADYSQRSHQLYPNTFSNYSGDTYLAPDGYLHVLSCTKMHGTFHHDNRYQYLEHAVFDVKTPGATPKLVYCKPIKFGDNGSASYCMRLTSDTNGRVYVVAMTGNRAEIWREKDENAFEFEMLACKRFANTSGVSTSVIIGNSRNGSTVDNTIACMFPADENQGIVYNFFKVQLPTK